MVDYSNPNAWVDPATGKPYPTPTPTSGVAPGTLGLAAPQQNAPGRDALGNPIQSGGLLGAASDFGDSFMGHAAYAPGANFGANANATAYNNEASALGAQQQAANRAQGQAAQQALQNQAGLSYATMNALANQYGQTKTPTVNMANANAALGQQNQALGLYQQAAMGNGPSAAQAQLASGLGQSIAAQQSAAASTRGGFGLANAQHDAAMQAGQLQAQAANQAAQLRAQEQQAGMAGYAGLGTQIQGQQASNAQFGANLAQQQIQMNAQNQFAAQNAANNQLLQGSQAGINAGLQYSQLGQNTGLQYNQLGEQALGQQLSADVANQQSQNQAMQGNAQRQQQGAGGLLSMVGSLF
jgi:hypothetical protein